MVVGRGVGHERVPVGAVASALGASLIPGSANPVAPGGIPVELGAFGAGDGSPVVAEAVELVAEPCGVEGCLGGKVCVGALGLPAVGESAAASGLRGGAGDRVSGRCVIDEREAGRRIIPSTPPRSPVPLFPCSLVPAVSPQ